MAKSKAISRIALSKRGARLIKHSSKRYNRTAKQPDVGPNVLQFGKKTRPKTILVMFHGQGDNATGNAEGWADVWARGLPGTLVVVPESPHVSIWDDGKNIPDPGRDWYRQHGSHDISDKEASIRKIQRVAWKTMQGVDSWLTRLLRKHQLRNEDLILAGFSQGNSLACILGANRGVKAIVICGGVCTENAFSASARTDDSFGRAMWPRWEEFMPKTAPRTKILAVNGTADPTVQRKYFVPMLANFDTTFRWEQGLDHDDIFRKRFRYRLLRWMQKILRN